MIGYVSVDEQVEKDFDRALLKASLHRLRNHLRRSSAHDRLLSFEEAKGALTQWSQAYRGMRTVEVEKIKGSVGRYEDFDRSFLPLKVDMADRWGRIDRAYHRGDELPAVSLYKIGEAYFVRDGNHRVSVAKYHKVATIDAEVVELRGQMRPDAAQRAAPSGEEAGAEDGEVEHSDGLVGARERPVSEKHVNRRGGALPRPSQKKKGAEPMTIKERALQMTITTDSKGAWLPLEGRSRVTAALGLLVTALLVAALMPLGASSPAYAFTTFTVTHTTDANNACDADGCSLREAITAANNTPNSGGQDLIDFNIPQGFADPQSGVMSIQPSSALPTITDPVVLDGYTQPSASPNTRPLADREPAGVCCMISYPEGMLPTTVIPPRLLTRSSCAHGADAWAMLLCMLSSREMFRSPEEVPEPYRGGPDRFERVLDLVEESLEGLLEDIRNHPLMNDRG